MVAVILATAGMTGITPVSYTHLDVYKRQANGLRGVLLSASTRTPCLRASFPTCSRSRVDPELEIATTNVFLLSVVAFMACLLYTSFPKLGNCGWTISYLLTP